MCFDPATAAAAVSTFFGGGAAATTAGGAAATAATTTAASGIGWQIAGLAASAGGTLLQGKMASDQAKQTAALLEQQRQTEAALAQVEDERTRTELRRQMATQRSQLAAMGVSLDSPLAQTLGDEAARELAFASQSVRSSAQAQDTELATRARYSRSTATQSLLEGGLGAAGKILTGAPDIWPSLKKKAVP